MRANFPCNKQGEKTKEVGPLVKLCLVDWRNAYCPLFCFNLMVGQEIMLITSHWQDQS